MPMTTRPPRSPRLTTKAPNRVTHYAHYSASGHRHNHSTVRHGAARKSHPPPPPPASSSSHHHNNPHVSGSSGVVASSSRLRPSSPPCSPIRSGNKRRDDKVRFYCRLDLHDEINDLILLFVGTSIWTSNGNW